MGAAYVVQCSGETRTRRKSAGRLTWKGFESESCAGSVEEVRLLGGERSGRYLLCFSVRGLGCRVVRLNSMVPR